MSLLTCVKEGLFAPEQLACYYVNREGRGSIFSRETVNKEGQLSGGLSSFLEPELEDIKDLLFQ